MPAVSVVMPVYNRADSVGRAIESVLSQDFTDFELLVVDDGSSDGTPARVEAIADPRVRCLRQPENQGGNVARNRGISEARGAVICFLDSDDVFLPHKLSVVGKFFETHSDIDVLIDSFRLICPASEVRGSAERINPVLWTSAEVGQAVFSRRLYKATPAISARRTALIAAGMFDPGLKRRQDMDLILRLARVSRCASISEVLWEKKWSPDSISAPIDTFVEATIEICRRHPDYLNQQQFRVGLSRDMARHFLRLSRRGMFATIRADWARCTGYFGTARTLGLLGSGAVEIQRRRKNSAAE